MAEKMSTFRLVVWIISGVLTVLAVLIFSGVGGFFERTRIISIEMWGTESERFILNLLFKMDEEYLDFARVSYVKKDARTYESNLVEALAIGQGPDLFMLPHEWIIPHKNKFTIIPYEAFSQRAFKDTFIEEGELYLSEEGILGLPFIVDPLVMYWNRNIFSTVGIANPPRFWDELFDLSEKITLRDQASNILRSTVALGEFSNIDHAKDILSILIMQAGDPITAFVNSRLAAVLGGRQGNPAEAALRFYTEFSNPVKSVYSWNRSLPQARNAFLAEDLAIYFGYASELAGLRAANPNLNFDVALLPQSREIGTKKTFGHMIALAIPRTTNNPDTAFRVAKILTGKQSIDFLSQFSNLPPTRRDLLAQKPTDAFKSIFYDSALIADAWYDPDQKATSLIFQDLIEDVTSGRARLGSAITTARDKILILFRQQR